MQAKSEAPVRSLVGIEDVGAATAFLAHDAARLITGETLYIDDGYHIIDQLKATRPSPLAWRLQRAVCIEWVTPWHASQPKTAIAR